MTESRDKVRLQNLRNFTVQIRRLSDEKIVGTGIAVTSDGKIATCAHVVKAAIKVHPRDAGDAEIGVYFPQLREGEEKLRIAKVAACFPEHDDDVALLQLTDGHSPLAPEQFPILGAAEPSVDNRFLSYGYSRTGKYPATRIDGTIMGTIDPPIDKIMHTLPVQLSSRHVSPGSSGSAVLDKVRNLVIGLISERYKTESSIKDDLGYAVDADTLKLPPFNLLIQVKSEPPRSAPTPKTNIAEAQTAVASDLVPEFHNAPPSLDEWVGRVNLLKNINGDWAEPGRKVTGLIGFGGEGKSCLARRWLDNLLSDESQPQPDGVFWWGFYESPNVDEFFEAALKYMSGGKIDPRGVPSSNAKSQIVAAMLGAGKYLFVLDGLEIMQHQERDRYGLLKSKDLQEFLEYFAAPEHSSFCLITSRAPLLDLMDYTTYTHRDVMKLDTEDGRDLLRKLGVEKGTDDALEKVVTEWDGHALTISLLGAHIADNFGGDISKIEDIDPPTAGEDRYERVHRVLRRYDEHLNDAERAFLKLFSIFRTPVEESAFDKVFRTETDVTAINAPITEMSDNDFNKTIERLVSYRILRYNSNEKNYTTHPLIRAHYSTLLREGDKKTTGAHERIKEYYLSKAIGTSDFPTLEDLKPLIEVVHHACAAGAYNEALHIFQERISQRTRFVLTQNLGAYETELALMQEFFLNKDTSQDPLVSDPKAKSWILNTIGLCLMSLGQLAEAVSFYERGNAMDLKMKDWENASRGYQNLAGLYTCLGELDESAISAREALALAQRAEDKSEERNSFSSQAWVAHLLGDIKAASEGFKQVEALEREIDPDKKYLYSLRGFWHADHLLRTGDTEYSRKITEANLKICERNYWIENISQCHRVLGDLDADAGNHDKAQQEYDEALRIARGISERDVLIKALLARGRWYARHKQDAPAAFNDLEEALGYAVDSGYRIYEANIRIALAWAHIADNNPSKGKPEAERAKQMSEKMGYYWGQVDADDVLQAIENL